MTSIIVFVCAVKYIYVDKIRLRKRVRLIYILEYVTMIIWCLDRRKKPFRDQPNPKVCAVLFRSSPTRKHWGVSHVLGGYGDIPRRCLSGQIYIYIYI